MKTFSSPMRSENWLLQIWELQLINWEDKQKENFLK